MKVKMEQLLLLKEMEIERLSKIKNTLKEQLIKIKKENHKFQEDLKNLSTAIKESDGSAYPELEEKIKEQEREIRALKKDLRREKLKNAKKGLKKSKGSDEPEEDISGDEDELEKDGVIGEIEEEVKMTVLMQQVKNGMFKLGQQNFSLENKLDFILETLQSGRVMPALESSGDYADSPTESTGDSPVTAATKKAESAGRKPSDILKARQSEEEDEDEYVSPGLQASNAGDEEPSEKVTRKPRKMMKPLVRAGKEDTEAEVPPPDSEAETEIKPKSALPVREIKTIKYPKDGALKCPHCKAQNFQEMVNKAKIISFTPVKKYGKKYYCKKCRGEWDYK